MSSSGNRRSQPAADTVLPSENVPLAAVRTAERVANGRLKTRLWWLTGACLLLALGLVFSSFRRQGTMIHVQFKDGFGLKAGDTLRYRGIDCGSVSSVQLTDDLGGVNVEILVFPGSQSLAVEGSQFWIQRARLSLGQVSGLDTVLGAKYVGVIPGKTDRQQREFVGLETPIAMTEGDSTEILVRFLAGEGLEVGNAVRYRGIKVGEVTHADLSADLQWVEVIVRLVGSTSELAREGTQFWIESPRLELTEVRGLDTLLGGSYIVLEPGPEQSRLVQEFVGLSEPPPLPRRPGSLEIELDASTRMGIVRGAPVVYRGLEVGKVVHVGLSKDGASVKVTAVVDSEYGELVREGSKWWAVGGFRFHAGLTGIDLSVDSISSWVRGGVAFATPPKPGKTVVTGHRFMLEPKPLDDWLQWQPRIAVGTHSRAVDSLALPTAQRVVASWKSTILGIGRRQTEQCWGLVINENSLALPGNFVESASSAGNGVTLEIGGQSLPFQLDQVLLRGAIGIYQLPREWSGERWAAENIQAVRRAEMVLLVINPELSEPLAIDSTRLEQIEGLGMKIAPGVPIPKGLNGSPVIDSVSGKVFGLLTLTDQGWVVGILQ